MVAIVNDHAVLESDIDNMFNILAPPSERADSKMLPLKVLKTQGVCAKKY